MIGKHRKTCLTNFMMNFISHWMPPQVNTITNYLAITQKAKTVWLRIGGERVFCNPPYGSKETGLWTEKCWKEAQKPNTLVVLLIPARTDRKSFHDFIYNKPNVTIRFLRGRLQFEDKGQKIGTAPFPSMICIFNEHLK